MGAVFKQAYIMIIMKSIIITHIKCVLGGGKGSNVDKSALRWSFKPVFLYILPYFHLIFLNVHIYIYSIVRKYIISLLPSTKKHVHFIGCQSR